MTEIEIEEQNANTLPEDDGWDWMMVEIFRCHRSHAGRGREVERFGAKMPPRRFIKLPRPHRRVADVPPHGKLHEAALPMLRLQAHDLLPGIWCHPELFDEANDWSRKAAIDQFVIN